MANVTPLAPGTLGSIVVNAPPFLNSGTITGSGGTITAAAQSSAGVAGWYSNGTSIVAGEMAIGAGLSIQVTGSGSAAVASLLNAGLVSIVGGNGAIATAGTGTAAGTITVAVANQGTIAGNGHITITPTSGVTEMLINVGTTAACTIDVGPPNFPGQPLRLHIKQGGTAQVTTLGTTVVPSIETGAFASTASASITDFAQLVAGQGSLWGYVGAGHGLAI